MKSSRGKLELLGDGWSGQHSLVIVMKGAEMNSPWGWSGNCVTLYMWLERGGGLEFCLLTIIYSESQLLMEDTEARL